MGGIKNKSLKAIYFGILFCCWIIFAYRLYVPKVPTKIENTETIIDTELVPESVPIIGPIESAFIISITDGDTLAVKIDGRGETIKVRLLEIDTPESVHPDPTQNNPFGIEAATYARSRLPVGSQIYLTGDSTDRDRYGRLLRLVWTEVPDNPFAEAEVREKCFNAELLLEGYAEVAIYDDNAYEEIFYKFQEEAMNNKKGLWSNIEWWKFRDRR